MKGKEEGEKWKGECPRFIGFLYFSLNKVEYNKKLLFQLKLNDAVVWNLFSYQTNNHEMCDKLIIPLRVNDRAYFFLLKIS